MNSQISGIVSNLLTKNAAWFLYVFVPANGHYAASVLRKRKNQIAILKFIAGISIYSYNQLLTIVDNGIKSKYNGLSPIQIINSLHLQNLKTTAISAIGKVVLKGSGEYIVSGDGTKVVGNIYHDTESGKYLNDKGQMIGVSMNQLSVLDAQGTQTDFWGSMNKIIQLIGNLFSAIGLTFDKNTSDNSPVKSEWGSYTGESNKVTQASMGQYLPVILGGAIVFYLFSQVNKK